MNKLFIFQKGNQSEYSSELECAYKLCQKNDFAKMIKLDDLSIEYLVNNSIEVVVSNGLSKEWYLILKGLNIVTVTLDRLETYRDIAEIVIDFKSKDSNKYFTGSDYSICIDEDNEMNLLAIANLIEKLEWDSNFFDIPIAFLSSRHLTENIIYQINKFIKKENIELVEYLCNCHDSRSVKIAESNGFHFTDIRLSFEKNLKEKEGVTLSDNITFDLAKKSDIPVLKEASKNLYEDSRYFFDGNFDINQVNIFYQNWVEKAVLGTFDDKCFCLYYKEKPFGFCTVKYDISNESASIGLFGLSKEYQGKGFAKKLLFSVFNDLIDANIYKVTVVTQGRNYSAQRLYQSAGFFTKSTELWYHKWI